MYRLHRGIMASGDGLEAAVRSFGPAAWYQPGIGVTGTLTAANWADQSGNGRDLAQGTAGNQPIYLPYSGTAYGWGSGVAGNAFSCPKPATALTGDLDLIVRIAADDVTAIDKAYIGKRRAANDFQFTSGSSAKLPKFFWWDGASLKTAASTVQHSYSNGAPFWMRMHIDVDDGAGNNVVRFYTSADGATPSWTILDTVTQAFTTSIDNGSDFVGVGSDESGGVGSGGNFLGKIYQAQVWSGNSTSGGTLLLNFSPSTFAETSTNGATAVASTGETWTLNSTGAKPAQIVKSAQLMTVAASTHYMATAGFTLDQPCTWYAVMAPTGYNSGADQVFVFGETTTTNVALYNQNGGSNLAIYAGSTAASVAAPTAGAFHVFSAVFNGASSLWSYDAQAANTGDPGAGNPSGLTIGAGLSAAAPASARYKELIVFPAAHTAAERSVVRNYLAVKHGIAL